MTKCHCEAPQGKAWHLQSGHLEKNLIKMSNSHRSGEHCFCLDPPSTSAFVCVWESKREIEKKLLNASWELLQEIKSIYAHYVDIVFASWVQTGSCFRMWGICRHILKWDSFIHNIQSQQGFRSKDMQNQDQQKPCGAELHLKSSPRDAL